MRARGIVAAALVALSLALPCVGHAAQIKPIVIDDDYGGTISTYIGWYDRLRESGVPVRVKGLCISACTLVLSLPKSQVCIEPTASLGFHLASEDGEADIPMTQAITRRYYPEPVRRWLVGKNLTLQPMNFMRADEVVSLDIFPACMAEVDSIVAN